MKLREVAYMLAGLAILSIPFFIYDFVCSLSSSIIALSVTMGPILIGSTVFSIGFADMIIRHNEE